MMLTNNKRMMLTNNKRMMLTNNKRMMLTNNKRKWKERQAHLLCAGAVPQYKVQGNIAACYNGVRPLRLASSLLKTEQSLGHRF
jgi:hypothetical protein